jgi:hypothetical protein
MNALTADIRAGKIETVIAADRSRIARNFTLATEWTGMLSEYGVSLIFANNAAHTAPADGLQYTKRGDYLLPNIVLSDPPDAPPLGQYGRMHKAYLKEHKSALYSRLLLSERLSRDISPSLAWRV